MSHWLRRSLLVARVNAVREYRKTRTQPTKIFFQSISVAFAILAVVGRLPIPGYERIWPHPGAYVYGTAVAAGDSAPVLATARGIAGVVFLLLCYAIVLPGGHGGSSIDRDADDLLLSIRPRTVAVGELLTYATFAGRFAGAVVVAGGVAFGVGVGSPVATLSILAAGTMLVLTAASVAYPISLSLRLAFLRFDVLRENKVLVGGPLVVGCCALFFWFRRSTALLGTSPLGWYADLGFLTAIPGTSPTRATAALLATPVAVATSALVAARLGEQLWLADEPKTETAGATAATASTARTAPTAPTTAATPPNSIVGSILDAFLRRIASRPVVAVVRVTWRRLRRKPGTLLFAGVLVAVTASVGFTVADVLPNSEPLVVAIYGAAAVGVGVTLNPLGNDGAVLPATLTTRNGGRYLLVGYALSAALPGGVLVGAATFVTAILTSAGTLPGAGLAALGVVLGVVAPVVSLGVGVALPKFDGFQPTATGSMQAPRLEAVTAFVASMVLVGLPALLGLSVTNAFAAALGLSRSAVAVGGAATTVLAAVCAGWLSFRYALATVREYELD